MSRQDPLKNLRQSPKGMADPLEVVSFMPLAEDSAAVTAAEEKERQRKARRAEYDRKNPVTSFYIPVRMKEAALLVKASLDGLATEKLCTVSSLSLAFISWALAEVRAGRLTVDGHPDLSQRKMAVVLVTNGDTWPAPRDIPAPPANKRDKGLYFGWRWNEDVTRQVETLANELSLSPGEVVVKLLQFALDAYKSGQANLVIAPVTIRQDPRIVSVPGAYK